MKSCKKKPKGKIKIFRKKKIQNTRRKKVYKDRKKEVNMKTEGKSSRKRKQNKRILQTYTNERKPEKQEKELR